MDCLKFISKKNKSNESQLLTSKKSSKAIVNKYDTRISAS